MYRKGKESDRQGALEPQSLGLGPTNQPRDTKHCTTTTALSQVSTALYIYNSTHLEPSPPLSLYSSTHLLSTAPPPQNGDPHNPALRLPRPLRLPPLLHQIRPPLPSPSLANTAPHTAKRNNLGRPAHNLGHLHPRLLPLPPPLAPARLGRPRDRSLLEQETLPYASPPTPPSI